MNDALDFLAVGELEVLGRLVDASNATLLCSITTEERAERCVYKPISGERPLWDFPDGTLAEREVAAFVVSQATGWDVVPPTIMRDGPAGRGMVQLWIDGDEQVDLIDLINSRPPALQRMAVLDAVINNSDRKGGHLIPMPVADDDDATRRHIWGVDHGVTFSVDDKLRTLLWQWAGQPLSAEALDVLTQLRAALEHDLGERLHELLTVAEVRRTSERVEELLATGTHPLPSEDWPSVPYPPF